jgi:acetolactate synthase I/II/III large subunit
MPQMSGGAAIVEALRREGVECIFGIPGIQIMAVYDALFGQNDIRPISVRHEQTAVYMADGYARVKNKPGAALVVPGPGVQNATAALGTAYACSSPLLLIAGQVETFNVGKNKGSLHEIDDQLDVVRPVTKWCRRVMEREKIPGAIHAALRQTVMGRPRPVYIEIPWDTIAGKSEVEFCGREPLDRLKPDREAVRRAVELLSSAKKPFIWAGGGIIAAEAAKELTALAEKLGAPVATTAEGKGAMPENHPLALGGAYYGFGAARWAATEADVILAVGTRFTWQMRPGTAPNPNQRLIHLDVDPEVIGKNFPAEVAVVADAQEGLKAILEEVRRQAAAPNRWAASEIERCRENHRRWLRKKAPLQVDLIGKIRGVLSEDAILISGITNVGYWCNLAYPVFRPRTYLTSSYFATLGYAFPTALGAKVAAPDRPVVCLTGDGGFLYAAGELATAVQYGINLVTIVFNDQAFGSTKSDQQRNYQGRIVETDLKNPDFVKLAEAFGVRGMKADPENIDRALVEALNLRQPVLIEVPIPTLVPPFQISPTEEI